MLIQEVFKLHGLVRQKLVGYLEHLTPEQLTDIPYGFRNHIWWNIVHVLVTQQLLCYYLSNQEMLIEMQWVEAFKKGSIPDDSIPSSEEIKKIKNLLMSTQQQLEIDYFQAKLNDYKAYSSSYGYPIKNIEDAILFNLVHENMHLGSIKSMRKLV